MVFAFKHSARLCCAGFFLSMAAPRIACASAGTGPTRPSLNAEHLAFEHFSETDLAALKQLLEQARWPASHLQALLGVEIQRRLNPPPALRREDLRPFHFWHTGPDAQPISITHTPEQLQARATREELARAKFLELFPPADADSELLADWEEQRRWGNLSAGKRAQVTALLENAAQARDDFLDQHGRLLTRPEWETLWAINRDARRRLTSLLTPEELLDYDIRNSNTAAQMRVELDAFAPTRDEFLALFQLRHPLELDFEDKPAGIDAAIDARRDATEKEIAQKIAALLGPGRFDDYRISLEPACQALRFDGRYARADAATVRRLYRTLVETKDRLARLDTQPPAQRDDAAASLKAGLHQDFRTVFDEETTRRFLQEQSLWP